MGSWNRRQEIKHISGRLYGVAVIEAHKFNKGLGVWEIISGVIDLDRSIGGTRKRVTPLARFEARLYDPTKLTVQITPIERKTAFKTAIDSVETHNNIGSWDTDRVMSWIRQEVVNVCHRAFEKEKVDS